MANKLLNPNFTDGTTYWENGPSDYPFYWDPAYKWIRGDSPTTQNYKIFTIQQPFNIADLVILAKLTAWRRYEAVAGNYIDGAVKARIKLQKPDSSWVTLVEETKTAETGSGNILDQYDILSHFSQMGNYKLMLQTESRSACNRANQQEKIEEPYGSWINSGFEISDPNCYVQSYPTSALEKYAKIEKTIEIYGATHTATLTLDAKGDVDDVAIPGYARFKVTLAKSLGGSWTLYDGYLYNETWTTILNALDIKSYMGGSGIYTLTLEAWVASGSDGMGNYFQSEAWYGNCELDAQWYSYDYVTSRGFWDDIVLDINIKKFKTVIESVECEEDETKKISISKKEDIECAESYSTKRLLLKSVSESIECAESFFKKIYKIVKESIECAEFYTAGRPKTISEDIYVQESYSWRKKILGTQSESVYVAESLAAKRTAGNIITYFDITDLTEWEDATPAVTAWIKEKTIMNT